MKEHCPKLVPGWSQSCRHGRSSLLGRGWGLYDRVADSEQLIARQWDLSDSVTP